jgi:hypothetical protein
MGHTASFAWTDTKPEKNANGKASIVPGGEWVGE